MFHLLSYYFLLHHMHIHTSILFILHRLLYLYCLYTVFHSPNTVLMSHSLLMSNNISLFIHLIMMSRRLPLMLYLYLTSSNLYYCYSILRLVLLCLIYIFHFVLPYFTLYHMHIIVSITFTVSSMMLSLHYYMMFHLTNIVPVLRSLFMSNNI